MRWLGRCPPFNIAIKIATAVGDTMDAFVNILEDIGDIGVVPHELDYYDELAQSRTAYTAYTACDVDMMRGWGCVVGSYDELSHILPAHAPAECPISHERFGTGTPIVVTDCAHVFAYESLKAWFGQSRSCPMCRKRMVSRDVSTSTSHTPAHAYTH